MNVQEQTKEYITSQPEPKRNDMQELHRLRDGVEITDKSN